MYKKLLVSMALLVIVGISKSAHAVIFFDVTPLGGTSWEYVYTVENDTLSSDIELFSIFFDKDLYENLAVTTPLGPDWFEDVYQPVPPILEGEYAVEASLFGLAPGEMQTGFSVSFDFLGGGIPGPQEYEIYDGVTFNTLESGLTTPSSNTVIPEPATMVLFGFGLFGSLFGLRRKK